MNSREADGAVHQPDAEVDRIREDKADFDRDANEAAKLLRRGDIKALAEHVAADAADRARKARLRLSEQR